MAKIIAKNKDAFFNYDLLEKFEAGIQLEGWEVKSIRSGQANIKNTFVNLKNGEAYLLNMHIKQYMATSGDELRTKKLLLHKKEILKLIQAKQSEGLSIVATKLKLNNKGLVKIEIAVAKGRNKRDKRELIKKRDVERKIKVVYKI